MNRNIPERFDKDKEYYSARYVDGQLLCTYKYSYYNNRWHFIRYGTKLSYPLICIPTLEEGEGFISKEEYEELNLVQELMK